MRARFLLTTVTLLLTAAILVPAATAQSTPPSPKVEAIVTWEAEHDMVMDETGRVDMGVSVDVIGVDFVCAQPMKLKVEILIDSFPQWAGASMVPKTVPTATNYFVFDGGQPGFNKAKAAGSGNTEAKLNIAWNIEDRPKTGAQHAYRVRADIKTESAGACSGSPSHVEPWSTEMLVKMDDVVVNPNATVNADVCEENPFAPGCATPTQQDTGGESPGPDVLIILLGLVGMVGLYRRNRRQ